jgi:hypothetical protein
MLWRALWGDVSRRFLRRKLPTCWVYRGGCHIAVHDRVPTSQNPDAGLCFFRVIETRKPVEGGAL